MFLGNETEGSGQSGADTVARSGCLRSELGKSSLSGTPNWTRFWSE